MNPVSIKVVLPLLATFLVLSCSKEHNKSKSREISKADQVWHYSVIEAMRRGIYEGTYAVKDLKAHGDFGLGTFNHLNGELIALDGIIYRIAPSGKVEVAGDSLKSPFTALSFFNTDQTKTIRFSGTFEELQDSIGRMLPSLNIAYAIKVDTEWENITVGGANPISGTDTTALATLMKTRPQYDAKGITGTMVGFFTPALMSNIDLSPFHFHFISSDKKLAGHLMSGTIKNAEIVVYLDQKIGYEIELLHQNTRFKTVRFKGANGAASY